MEVEEQLLCPLALVRESASFITSRATHVTLDQAALSSLAAEWLAAGLLVSPAFDREVHFVDESRPALTAQYLFVLDSLNWCFWPDAEAAPAPEEAFEYVNLAGGLRRAVEENPRVMDAAALSRLDGPGLRALLGFPRPLPCEEERARVLRQSAAALLEHFEGSAAKLVTAARGSASRLVSLLTAHFPAFRDHALFAGRQVYFYKRAQIFVADLHGAFDGAGLGAFTDISALTTFADYRVPVVLRKAGCLRYSTALAAAVDAKQEVPAGSAEECELRGATIQAVEVLRDALAAAAAADGLPLPTAVHVDWRLWELGEASRLTDAPHHRTRSVYY